MKITIQGLQKLTLLDFPGRVACTVFTKGCNLRCPFCHNAPLVLGTIEPPIEEDEFFSFLEKRRGILDGVCITGGEPLLQPDIEKFIKKIKSLGYAVKLDTNGTFPDRLARLIEICPPDYIAADIKSSQENYSKACGTETDINDVIRSVELIKSSGIPHEFRTTAVASLHTEDDFIKIAEWLGKDEKYFIQNFIDSGDLVGEGQYGFSKDEMEHILALVKPIAPLAELRGI